MGADNRGMGIHSAKMLGCVDIGRRIGLSGFVQTPWSRVVRRVVQAPLMHVLSRQCHIPLQLSILLSSSEQT